jgi:two-component system, cell cycle sensor histidine kinase and response regulator CckA
MPSSSIFDTHIRAAALEHLRATQFLNRSSRAIVVLLAAMAASMWITPFARADGHTAIAGWLIVAYIVEVVGLVALVAILQRRLAAQIRSDVRRQDVLVEQKERLVRQNDEMARQTDALKLLTRRLTAAQRAAQLGYWEIDCATGTRYWTREMYQLWGIPKGEKPPESAEVIEAVHPDDRERFRGAITGALHDHTPFREQVRIVLPSGEPRIVETQGRVVVDADGADKLIGTVQDVTNRVQLEMQLRQSQKMDAIGQLAGGVAHDFNNILTVIEGYANLLTKEQALDDGNREAVQEILDSSQRAAALTRQLLAFSRQQVLQPRLLDMNEAIGGVEKMLRRLIGENIEFVSRLEASLALVMADPGQIEQVLLNLALNSRDAMPHGGVLVVETANVLLDDSHAANHPIQHPGMHVMLSVTDTGSGIEPNVMDRIFEPFFTTKENGKGTGLGLATVHGIVEQSGGHCCVRSQPGRGTTFSVYLPAHTVEAECPRDERARSAPRQPGGSETILFVEDDESLRTMASTILRRFGYTVIEAADGLEALRVCGDSSVSIDILVTDMVMPALDGRNLAMHVQRLRPGLPTLLMSGYTSDRALLQTDGVSFLEKPFTPEELQGMVRRVLDAGVSVKQYA